MTMHPSLSYDIISLELEMRARDAERRRFVLDHPDQIIRMPRKPWLRAIGRFFHLGHRTPRSRRAVRA
ncbi:hypothetical protein PU630_02580 [Microbacterium horticulturae]|uniref:Uncharacterized protein n=1 Tax=Microbacterium horticulturae TaxID=3028316 RepID=A0ABY8C2A4_9MICO|nr:hypothetical protein [Microbacterium sp. KACC 23027]WEG09472.1 hypothetical protein PU630_02580 [Microbacterium sp. KACC 23027]